MYFTLICCVAWLVGCKENARNHKVALSGIDEEKEIFAGVFINNSPSVQPSLLNECLKRCSTTEEDFALTAVADGTKTFFPNDSGVRRYDYRFKLVGEYAALKVTSEQGNIVETQATHIKITDDAKYAFVSYNTKYDDCLGGIVIFNISDIERPSVVATLGMNNGEFSAIDYDPVKSVLYATGATVSPSYGYKGDSNPAFVMSAALDGSMKFKDEVPTFKMLTSYQGTSIKVANGQVYVTTGDGTQGTQGGLYILNQELTEVVNFIEADNARSIDVDENGNLYLMQAEYARVTKFDANGNNPILIYSAANEAKQAYAKSEIAVWNNYIFVAENESGLRMINIKDQTVAKQLIWTEGSDPENHVTNSVAINSDKKMCSKEGSCFESNLLLLANGGKGLYWYDIVDNQIMLCNNNSVDFGNKCSLNHVASRGNVVFVADGLLGLKILSIGAVKHQEWDCTNSFLFKTYLERNGKNAGQIFFKAAGEELIIDIQTDENYETPGIFFGTSLEDFKKAGLMSESGFIDGKMDNMNSDKRESIPCGIKGVRFTFDKSDLPQGKLLCVIYFGNSWGHGKTFGSSGSSGTGKNNSQYIELGEVTFCKPCSTSL